MDTQDTGTTEEQSSTEQTEETTTSDTSADGNSEDVDAKRIADKEAYLKELDRQIKEKETLRNKAKKSEPEDQDDVITWMALNADNLKLVGKEFQEELAFYKSHKIPVTNDIRDRALRDARARKGVRNVESERQAATSSEVQGETRKTAKVEMPETVEQLAKEGGTTLTPERFAKYKAEFDARKKRS